MTQIEPGPDGLTITKPREQVEGFQAAYAELYNKAKHIVVKPGDRLPITGVEWRIATSAGNVLKTPPLPGGGKPNPACANFTPMAGTTGMVDPDDAQSVGSVIILGQFRAADFGDMWRTKELELMCPNNPLGTVDLLLREQSRRHRVRFASVRARPSAARRAGAERHAKGRRARSDEDHPVVAGPRGALADALVVQRRLEQNAPGLFIANVDDAADDRGHADRSAARRWTRSGAWRRGSAGAPAAGTPAAAPLPQPRLPAPLPRLRRRHRLRRHPPRRLAAAGGQAAAPAPRWWTGSRKRNGAHACVLAQGHRVRGRELHNHEPAEWVQQDLREVETRDRIAPFDNRKEPRLSLPSSIERRARGHR